MRERLVEEATVIEGMVGGENSEERWSEEGRSKGEQSEEGL